MTPVLVFAGGLVTAAFGGWLFASAGVPLAWILGAMTGSALWANLAGAGKGTRYARRAGQLVVGAATGAILTPDVLDEMVGLLPAMIAAAVVANATGILLAWPLARLAGVDRRTGLLSTLPAGMSEMASLAREVGARAEVVTVVHTLRVVLVVGCVPFLFGFSRSTVAVPAAPDATVAALVACVVSGAVLAMAGRRLGMLNPWVVMPMAAGVAIVALGFPLATMPRPLLVAAQVCIGFSLGARLRREDFARVPRAAVVGLGCNIALIATMLVLALPLFARWTGIEAPTLALGLAPGGIGEMIASAKALGAAAALVAGFQFTRSFLTNLLAPPLILRLAGPAAAKADTDENP